LRQPIFGHLSNIAQRERARKEIVTSWGLQDRASAKAKFKKGNPDLQEFEEPR
jgi:hypothetical protein